MLGHNPKVLSDLSERLTTAISLLQIELSAASIQKLALYVLELEKWNKTYNLTALKSIDAMLVQHVFDSLSILPAMQEYTLANDIQAKSLLDVGSGAGLPGVVLAVANPAWHVTCLDAVQKKCSFVANVAARLGICNLTALHARVEETESLESDVVISRAFASLKDFTMVAGHHARPGGVLVAMKSRQVKEDIKDLELSKTDWQVDQIEPITVPELMAERYMVWLRRKIDYAR